MGQAVCGQQVETQTQILNPHLFNDSQIIVQQRGDNPSKQKLDNKFLQTQVIASWNILTEKTTGFININLGNKKDNLQKEFNDKNNKRSIQQIKPQNEMIAPVPSITQSTGKRKFRNSCASSNYENIEIDVSNFIKIRTQNIHNFYDFLQRIGEGSFGHVYKATEKKSGEIRAIKALKKVAMNSISKMSFIAEIDLLKKLDHPNIIKLYDLFLHDGNYYVVTQYCEGGCLQKYYNAHKGSISVDTTRIIMKQLISTLNYLYNMNIVHRDLKLENLVFLKKPCEQKNQNFQLKLIDFGTAIKVQKHKKNESGLVGTLYYIAPEFAKGFYTQKCDIWSAGVIFFQLLFSQYPFKGKNQKQLLNQITTKNIQWNVYEKRKVLKQALQIVQTMLDKNYLTRVSIKNLMQNEWIRSASIGRASRELNESTAFNLSQYNRKNNFVSIIESFLSFKKTTQEQRQQLSKMFFQIDKDDSGIIETNELIQFYKKHFPNYEEQVVIQIVSNVDKNQSGKIDFNQFLTAMATKNSLFAQQALKQAFEYVDKDGTGFISKKQIKNLLKMADKRQIEEIFGQLDQNGDNQISLEEFKSYLMSIQD